MTAFWSGVMLIASLGLFGLFGGIVVYAIARSDPPSEFEKRQAAMRGETIREFRRRARPF